MVVNYNSVVARARLVLHRAHVEVVDRDDVVHAEVVLAAELALVPRHRALERRESVRELVDVRVRRVDRERDLSCVSHRGALYRDGDAAKVFFASGYRGASETTRR